MEELWKNYGTQVLVGIITALLTLLLSDPIKALLIKFSQWIGTKLFSPDLGFRTRYFRALAENHKWLRLIGIYNPADLHPPRLNEVYVSLRLSTSTESPTIPWEDIFNSKEKQIVILGQPGIGKSTFLDYLILILTGIIAHPLSQRLGNPIPIFVRLRNLSHGHSSQNLLDLIESPQNIGLKNIPLGYFSNQLKRGRCVVLLDGLDEVIDKKQQQWVVNEIRLFANEYPNNWIIVTCRLAGWLGQLPNFKNLLLQEFNNDDIRQYIFAWYREVIRTELINRLGVSPELDSVQEVETKAYQISLQQAESLWTALQNNEGILRIVRTPLILSLVTLVHKSRSANLPKARARLYRECLDILLDVWDAKDKGLAVPNAPMLNQKLVVLRAIAFHYAINGLMIMDESNLENLIAPLLPSLNIELNSSSFIRQIYERSGVLVEQAIGQYGFAHFVFLDYLAAAYIVEQGLDSVLLEHVNDIRWREIILVAISLMSPRQRAVAFIESLLVKSNEDTSVLALAGWSLAEDVQIPEKLRNQIVTRLITKINQIQDTNTEEHRLLTNVLATIGYGEITILGSSFRVEPFRGSGMVVGEINELGLRIINNIPEERKYTVEIVEPSAEYEVVSSNPLTTRLMDFRDIEEIRFQLRVKAIKQVAINYKVNGELQSPPIYINATKDNPYAYGKPAEGLAFLDRTNLTDQIIQAVTKPTKQDSLIIGERRMGKTSLLFAINQKLNMPFVPVYLVLSENEPNTKIILKSILRQITISLVEKGLVEEKEVVEYQKLDFKPALTEIVKKARVKLHDLKIVLLVDEADHVLETLIDVSPIVKFLFSLIGKQRLLVDNYLQNTLRASLQSSDLDLRAVFVGTSLLLNTTSEYTSPLFNHFRTERLTTLSDQETRILITKPAESLGYSISPKVVNRIEELSGGFPYYCQALCYEALQLAIQANRTQIIEQDMKIAEEKVINELYKTSFLEGIWNRLNRQEKRCLIALARKEKVLNSKQLQRLVDWQIVVHEPNGNAIRSKLIEIWISMVIRS